MLPLVRSALTHLLSGHSPYVMHARHAMPGWSLPLTYLPVTQASRASVVGRVPVPVLRRLGAFHNARRLLAAFDRAGPSGSCQRGPSGGRGLRCAFGYLAPGGARRGVPGSFVAALGRKEKDAASLRRGRDLGSGDPCALSSVGSHRVSAGGSALAQRPALGPRRGVEVRPNLGRSSGRKVSPCSGAGAYTHAAQQPTWFRRLQTAAGVPFCQADVAGLRSARGPREPGGRSLLRHARPRQTPLP